tara:strand:+ start:587 stop:844 length:258 start_codon:yes stop_codon:yes gene_type:complete
MYLSDEDKMMRDPNIKWTSPSVITNKGVNMYLVIEETKYDHATPMYNVKSQDESFSIAQKKKEALELLNERDDRNYYVTGLPVKS